ncbi:MAG TPA: hypothetical protein VIV07_04340 [Sphingomicrobium sp.]
MRKLLLLSILPLVSAAPTPAAATAQCAAKPFTLNKPAATPAKAAAATTVQAAAKPVAPKLAAKPPPKPRLLASCKDKTKKG